MRWFWDLPDLSGRRIRRWRRRPYDPEALRVVRIAPAQSAVERCLGENRGWRSTVPRPFLAANRDWRRRSQGDSYRLPDHARSGRPESGPWWFLFMGRQNAGSRDLPKNPEKSVTAKADVVRWLRASFNAVQGELSEDRQAKDGEVPGARRDVAKGCCCGHWRMRVSTSGK
jgi:hypothetical protein